MAKYWYHCSIFIIPLTIIHFSYLSLYIFNNFKWSFVLSTQTDLLLQFTYLLQIYLSLLPLILFQLFDSCTETDSPTASWHKEYCLLISCVPVTLEVTFLQFLLRARISQRRHLHAWRLLGFCKSIAFQTTSTWQVSPAHPATNRPTCNKRVLSGSGNESNSSVLLLRCN